MQKRHVFWLKMNLSRVKQNYMLHLGLALSRSYIMSGRFGLMDCKTGILTVFTPDIYLTREELGTDLWGNITSTKVKIDEPQHGRPFSGEKLVKWLNSNSNVVVFLVNTDATTVDTLAKQYGWVVPCLYITFDRKAFDTLETPTPHTKAVANMRHLAR